MTVELLQALVDKWRRLSKADAIAGVNQALVDDREYFGRVNAAIATRQCMEELEQALILLSSQPSAPIPDEDHLDIYVPGALRCPKCEFELMSQTLFMRSGDVGMTREQALGKNEGEPCPNDGTPMIKVRWADRARDNYEAYGRLMNEIITASGLPVETANLPAALDRVRQLASQPSAIEQVKMVAALQGYCCPSCARDFYVPRVEEAYQCPMCGHASPCALVGPFSLLT